MWVALSSSQNLWCSLGAKPPGAYFCSCVLGEQSSVHSHHTDLNEVTEVPRGSSSCGCENLADHHWYRWQGDLSRAIEGERTFTPWDFLDSHAKDVFIALRLQHIPSAKTEAKLNYLVNLCFQRAGYYGTRSQEADCSMLRTLETKNVCCYSWHQQIVVRFCRCDHIHMRPYKILRRSDDPWLPDVI